MIGSCSRSSIAQNLDRCYSLIAGEADRVRVKLRGAWSDTPRGSTLASVTQRRLSEDAKARSIHDRDLKEAEWHVYSLVSG